MGITVVLFLHYTGTAMLLEQHPDLIVNFTVDRPEQRLCRKDTGESKKLRKWSRGHQFIVRGGGHIDSWQPLYRLVYIHYEHCMHEPWLNAWWCSVFVVVMACQWRSLLSYLEPGEAVMHVHCMQLLIGRPQFSAC